MFGDEPYVFRTDPRISAAHFAHHNLRAHVTSSAPDGGTVGVTVVEGALPDQTDAQMVEASTGALGRTLRWSALAAQHRGALLLAKVAGVVSQAKTVKLRQRVRELESAVRDSKRGRKAEVEAQNLRR